ncbi:MAG: tricarballylate utilization protein TcuB, partial [Chloroflexi bacterium]|nr:tricarballylate utilization protein TcuB [Chloroflexota bacterium]
MPPTDLIENAIWQLEVCNACRYCEGYCAVFPAMERRQRINDADVYYLANLCHDCRPCYYACMYTPPHEFAVNLPQAFSEVRRRTYTRYALPNGSAGLAGTSFGIVAVIAALGTILFGAILALTGNPARLFSAHEGPGAFEAVIPYLAMVLPALLIALYGVASVAVGV